MLTAITYVNLALMKSNCGQITALLGSLIQMKTPPSLHPIAHMTGKNVN